MAKSTGKGGAKDTGKNFAQKMHSSGAPKGKGGKMPFATTQKVAKANGKHKTGC